VRRLTVRMTSMKAKCPPPRSIASTVNIINTMTSMRTMPTWSRISGDGSGVSVVLTLPILVLSPMLQKLLGLREAILFPGDLYVLFAFSSAVFFYGGWPFLTGFFDELKSRKPGMMTPSLQLTSTAPPWCSG
jgi:cation transport ATPase